MDFNGGIPPHDYDYLINQLSQARDLHFNIEIDHLRANFLYRHGQENLDRLDQLVAKQRQIEHVQTQLEQVTQQNFRQEQQLTALSFELNAQLQADREILSQRLNNPQNPAQNAFQDPAQNAFQDPAQNDFQDPAQNDFQDLFGDPFYNPLDNPLDNALDDNAFQNAFQDLGQNLGQNPAENPAQTPHQNPHQNPPPDFSPMNIPVSSMVTETPGALIASHSHIRGLGVDLDTLAPRFSSQGLVGQERARKAAALIIKMVEERKIAGRAILIAGPPSTGKTAIAMGMAQTLGSEVPFVTMSGSEIYSKEMSKTEALTQAFRKGVAVRVSEETEFIEGEVVEIQLDKSVTQANRQGRIIMKTNDMESAFNLGPKLIDSLEKEHVIAGDIISVNMSSNRIVKLGRSYARSRDYDAMGKDTKFVTCPDGELRKRKEETHIVSLHEIDVINSRPQGYMGLFSGDTGEIPSETRDQINVKVDEWKEEGKADLLPGVLFIDEVHMLDVEAFSFMNKWTENELSPIIIMASNRGNATVRGTLSKAPHGMPLDFLDRCVIISTHPYNANELQEILKIRAQEEEVDVTESALALLTRVAEERGLRYASQLIATSFEIAKKRKGGEAKVDEKDVERAYGLFLDPKRSQEVVEGKGESMELS